VHAEIFTPNHSPVADGAMKTYSEWNSYGLEPFLHSPHGTFPSWCAARGLQAVNCWCTFLALVSDNRHHPAVCVPAWDGLCFSVVYDFELNCSLLLTSTVQYMWTEHVSTCVIVVEIISTGAGWRHWKRTPVSRTWAMMIHYGHPALGCARPCVECVLSTCLSLLGMLTLLSAPVWNPSQPLIQCWTFWPTTAVARTLLLVVVGCA
jgi:hypothetical protein